MLRKTRLPASTQPMKRTALTRRTRLRFRSRKTAAVYRTQRVPLVKALLGGAPLCQLILNGCTGLADTVHEIKPRGRGGSIVNPANLLPACANCNDAASNGQIGEAQARRLLLHSWDDEGGRCAAPDGGDADAA